MSILYQKISFRNLKIIIAKLSLIYGFIKYLFLFNKMYNFFFLFTATIMNYLPHFFYLEKILSLMFIFVYKFPKKNLKNCEDDFEMYIFMFNNHSEYKINWMKLNF